MPSTPAAPPAPTTRQVERRLSSLHHTVSRVLIALSSATAALRKRAVALACSRVWPEFYLAKAVGKEQLRLTRLYPSPLNRLFLEEATMCADITKPSLYDRLGGIYAIATVVDDFIDRIMIDPALNANPLVDDAHHRVGKAGFKYLVTEMVGWATGGPQKYTGRSMRDSHVDLKITEGEWVAFCKDFQDTLDKFKVPATEQQELFAIVQSTKEDIVSVAG